MSKIEYTRYVPDETVLEVFEKYAVGLRNTIQQKKEIKSMLSKEYGITIHYYALLGALDNLVRDGILEKRLKLNGRTIYALTSHPQSQ